MYFYLMAGFRKLLELFGGGMARDGAKGERENEKKRPGVASTGTQQWEKEKWEWWPAAPEGYKFMSMQHKVASTTSQPIRTPSPLSHLPTPISYHPPNSPFDTGSGVPIDLDRLKTRRNHRRQLLRTPLSGMSCGRIGVGEILARELFCRWMSNDALSSVQLLKVDREERCGDDCNGERAGSWNRPGLSAINKTLDAMLYSRYPFSHCTFYAISYLSRINFIIHYPYLKWKGVDMSSNT